MYNIGLNRIGPDDEGELLQFQVRIEAGNVVIHFDTEVTWFGMPPRVARMVARALTGAADQIDGNIEVKHDPQ